MLLAYGRQRLTLRFLATVTEMSESIDPKARLIAALAENMSDRDWGSDILNKCAQIRQALERIEQIARSRAGGER